MSENNEWKHIENEYKQLKKIYNEYKKLQKENKAENESLKVCIWNLLDIAHAMLLHDLSDIQRGNIQVRIDKAEALIKKEIL